MNPNLWEGVEVGGVGGGGLELINCFTKNSNQKKKEKKNFGRGGVGGARVSDFFLQRIQIKKKKKLWGGGGGGEGA